MNPLYLTISDNEQILEYVHCKNKFDFFSTNLIAAELPLILVCLNCYKAIFCSMVLFRITTTRKTGRNVNIYAGEMFAFSFTNAGALSARPVFKFSRYTVCSHAL